MKKLILAVTIFVTFNVKAGYVLIASEYGLLEAVFCTLESYHYSEANPISKFSFSCEDTSIELVDFDVLGANSEIIINGIKLNCNIYNAEMSSSIDFNFIVNCNQINLSIFKNSFN